MPESPPPLARASWPIPPYYHPISTPPTCPGWYFCQLNAGLAHLYWPDDGQWAAVTHWVELPRFIQELLKTDSEVV